MALLELPIPSNRSDTGTPRAFAILTSTSKLTLPTPASISPKCGPDTSAMLASWRWLSPCCSRNRLIFRPSATCASINASLFSKVPPSRRVMTRPRSLHRSSWSFSVTRGGRTRTVRSYIHLALELRDPKPHSFHPKSTTFVRAAALYRLQCDGGYHALDWLVPGDRRLRDAGDRRIRDGFAARDGRRRDSRGAFDSADEAKTSPKNPTRRARPCARRLRYPCSLALRRSPDRSRPLSGRFRRNGRSGRSRRLERRQALAPHAFRRSPPARSYRFRGRRC